MFTVPFRKQTNMFTESLARTYREGDDPESSPAQWQQTAATLGHVWTSVPNYVGSSQNYSQQRKHRLPAHSVRQQTHKLPLEACILDASGDSMESEVFSAVHGQNRGTN